MNKGVGRELPGSVNFQDFPTHIGRLTGRFGWAVRFANFERVGFFWSSWLGGSRLCWDCRLGDTWLGCRVLVGDLISCWLAPLGCHDWLG